MIKTPLQTHRTADSDKYDKESNDRLVQAAVAFCEAHAKKFAPAAAPQAPANGWQLVPGQAVNYTAKATGPAADGQRPFSLRIGWLPGFEPGMTLRFPVCPGRVDGLLFRLPSDASVVGKTMAISTTLDAAAVKTESATLTSLQMQIQAVGGEANGEASGDVAGSSGGDGDAAGNNGDTASNDGGGAEAPADALAHVPVLSQFGTPAPMAEVHARLCVEPKFCAEEGDCYPLASMCGFELSADQVATPSADTTEIVRVARNDAVDIIAGTGAIGGITSAIVRIEEGMLVETPAGFEDKMAPWRASYHWATDEAKLSAAFMFSFAVHVERTVIVLELKSDGEMYNDPARAYGMRDLKGVLCRTPAKPGKEETVPFFFSVKLADLPSILHARACSLLQYNREGVHFQPLVRDIAWTEETGPEDVVVDGAGDELTDVEMEDVEMGDGDYGGEFGAVAVVDAEVLETPPEQVQPTQVPMAPLRATHVAEAKSLAAARAAAEVVLVAEVTAEEVAPSRKRAVKPESAEKAAARAAAKVEKEAAKDAVKEAKAAEKEAKKAEKEAAKPMRQPRKRKAATVAAAVIAEEDEELDAEELAPRAVRAKAAPEPTHAQTMEECLSGRFSHLEAVVPTPTWLADALENDSSRLHGSLMAFHWEGWGWHAARIGDTSAMGCNYSALYMDKWREDHTLFVSDYGTGGVGNWVLLEGTPPLIMDFKAGKYMVKIDEADVWFRAENLIEYSGESLAAAREVKKAAAVEASQQAVEAELDTGGHAINARVFAKGLAPDGEVAWFIAQVIGHRPLKYPPCVRDLQTQTTVEPTMGLLIPGPCVFTGSRSSTSPRGTEKRRRWCSRSLAPPLCPHRTCKLKSRSDESSRRVHSAPITHRNRDSQRDLRHRC